MVIKDKLNRTTAMKKKYLALGLSALIALAGCTLDERMINDEVVPSGREMTIEAVRENLGSEEGGLSTRTMRDEESGSVLWVPGDAISLFYGSGANGGSKFISTLESGSSDMTNFTGTITAITGGGELTVDDTYFWGVYPYGEDVSCDGQGVTMTVPTSQEATPGTFAPNTFPSVGRSQGLIMGFYNICGGWRFSVTKEGIKKVTLKSNGGEPITGKVKVMFDAAGVPVIEEVLEGSDEVVLEAPSGEYFEVGKNYYMVLLPTVFESGFTMTFETFTESGEYNRTKKTTIARSKFSGIANLDNYLTTPYTKKTGPIPVEDANFKAYLVSNFDTNKDGEISYEEALEITEINVCTDDIESLRGLEYMTGLQSLSCYGSSSTWSNELQMSVPSGKLTSLDVSANTALTNLRCQSNQLTSLDVSNNAALTYLSCRNNQLTSLDVSANTALIYLYCGQNQLASLDVSANTALTSLGCGYNQLTALDVSANTALTGLYCNNNQLTSLDVSNNTALESLYCGNNQLTSLGVSANAALTYLSCGNNQLTSLDVSNNTALTSLDCSDNQLTSLDVSANTALTSLDCSDNQLTSLDVSANTALRNLSCGDNQLTSLNVSANTALRDLSCYCNRLTSLDVSNNTALTILSCGANQLTSLDVSSNTALTDLYCSPMNDSAGNNLLSVLYIAQGQEIPNVTINRSESMIPAETQIVVAGGETDVPGIVSLGFIPQATIGGTPGFYYQTYAYNPLYAYPTSGLDSKNEIWRESEEEMSLMRPTIIQYHVNGTNCSLDDTYEYSFIMSNTLSDFSMAPAFVSYADGVLSLEVQFSGKEVAEVGKTPLFALKIKKGDFSIVSDYATLKSNEFGNMRLACPKVMSRAFFDCEDLHYRRGTAGISELDMEAFHSSPVWTTEFDYEHCDTTVNYAGDLNLNLIVAVHCEEINPQGPDPTELELTDVDMAELGLSYSFELVRNYSLGIPARDQSRFVTLQDGILYPSDGINSVGYTPIVRVNLMRGDDIVQVAYLKVGISK